MMNKPYIDELAEKGESRYTLIAVAAKRARQITEDNPELSRSGEINPVSQALHEINEDKLRWYHKNADSMDTLNMADFKDTHSTIPVSDFSVNQKPEITE
jgi:DNA-directed RNA polymerase omega subunit